MKFATLGLQAALFACFLVASCRAAALENFKEEVRELLFELENEAEVDLEARQNCASTQGSFFGLEFALSGYNILYGFPKEGGRDPGWRAAIFEANFDDSRYTSDCSYELPRGVDMQRTVACSTSFTSKETKTAVEYEEQLEASASVSGGGWGASFSASASYNEAMKEMRDEAAVFVMSEAKCLYYTSIMQPGSPPPLSKAFLSFLKELELDDSAEKYFDFFEHYGTHFVKSIDFGARYSRTHEMTQSAYERISNSAYSVEASASYEGLFSVSGSMSLSESQREAVNEFKKSVTTKVSTLGALPNAEGDHNKWASQVKDTPAPVIYNLLSIDELFTRRYFKDVSGHDYDKIRQNILKYKVKEEYCEKYLKARNPGMSCEVPTEPVCTLPNVEYGTFSCKTPSGRQVAVPSDGVVCTLTCDAGPFIVNEVDPEITCRSSAFDAQFDKIPSCKKYNIWQMESPAGEYELDYYGAKAICESNGARLATKDELETAQEQGLEMCDCGFVADDTYYGWYPMQTSIYGCGSNVGVNRCNWGDMRWDAWCTM